MAKTAAQIKDEIQTEIRCIIKYRKALLMPTNSLDYEEIQKNIIAFAGAVFHFKERLAAWAKKSNVSMTPTISEIAENNVSLLVCGDLFNYKKHGGCENRSKLSPLLSGATLKTEGGPIGLRFDGKMKSGELDRSVPFVVEIYCSENRTLGNAVEFISKAFSIWTPIMRQIGLLRQEDGVDAMLLKELAQF